MSESSLGAPLGARVPMPGGDVVGMPGGIGNPPRGAPETGSTAGGALGAGGNTPPPQGAPTTPQGAGNGGFHGTLAASHGAAKAAFENTGKALTQIDAIRKGLSALADKADMVTPEDVIEEAGKLVGHGIDPRALAGVLADMPQEGGGEALGGWVAVHAQTAEQAEQQLLVAHASARQAMGTSAMHLLMAHAAAQGAAQQALPPAPPPQDNPLSPGAPA